MTSYTTPEPVLQSDMLAKRLDRERRARRHAEEILEAKSRELYEVNEALSKAHSAIERQLDELRIEKDRVEMMAQTDLLTGISSRSTLLASLDKIEFSYNESSHQQWLFCSIFGNLNA